MDVHTCAYIAVLEAQTLALHRLDVVANGNFQARNAFIDFKQSILKLISMLYSLRPHADKVMRLEEPKDGS